MARRQPAPVEPIDADADLPVPAQPRRRDLDPGVVGAVALGGVVGAEARYGLAVLIPHQPGQWPMATWLTNVSGCFLIGVLMVVITELTSPHRLVRPLLGVGILGGYTTFSTAMVDVQQLAVTGHARAAFGYLFGTLAAALVATWLGMRLTRASAGGWVRWRAHGRERS